MCTPGLWSGDTSINIITNALIHSRVWSAASAATIRCPSGDRVHPCCTAEAFAVNFYHVILLWHIHYQVNTIFNVHVSVCATLLHHIDQHTGRRRCLCHLPCEHNPGVQKQKENLKVSSFTSNQNTCLEHKGQITRVESTTERGEDEEGEKRKEMEQRLWVLRGLCVCVFVKECKRRVTAGVSESLSDFESLADKYVWNVHKRGKYVHHKL